MKNTTLKIMIEIGALIVLSVFLINSNDIISMGSIILGMSLIFLGTILFDNEKENREKLDNYSLKNKDRNINKVY